MVPSPFESLSLLALEAMAVGTPVLCNARAEVLVDHCVKSNAGLFYADRDEFIECTKLLLADERMRDRMGRNGKEYIKRNYRWDVIMSKYDRLIGSLRRMIRLILLALVLQFGQRPALTPAETLLEPVILRAINEQPSGGVPATLIEGTDQSAGEILITCRDCAVATHAMEKLHSLITEKGMPPPARAIRRLHGAVATDTAAARRQSFMWRNLTRGHSRFSGVCGPPPVSAMKWSRSSRVTGRISSMCAPFENVGQIAARSYGQCRRPPS